MKKPAEYDQIDTSLFEPLAPGGHYLDILRIKEDKSKSGRDMLIIQFDTADNDTQPKWFRKNHRGKEFYYQGTAYIVLGDQDWAVRNLKRFITSVENSNPGFIFDWSSWDVFKGKKVGGVFREEEYLNKKNQVRTSTRLAWYTSWNKVSGADIPDKKLLDTDTNIYQVNSSGMFETEDDLPFDI